MNVQPTQPPPDSAGGTESSTDAPRILSGWRGRMVLVALGIGLSMLLLAVLEFTLAALDIGGDALYDDPFVGFAPGSDLFAPATLADGTRVYQTRPEKLTFFNPQSFLADKPDDGYRVFALGGSTTAGRPYDDRVAFPRWLELYLAEADPSRSWEVVNAGAISYASYRVALLMHELVRYEPDLFVLYTGHNEFLEERTYSEVIHQPEALKRARMWLSGFRFAALARRAVSGGDDEPTSAETTLAPEVAARLDTWDGLERYERDDALSASVLAHFESNLRRMIRLARAHDAEVILVQPISNVADFSPFKSQSGAGVDEATAERVAGLVERGKGHLAAGEPAAAVTALEEATSLDPRFADAWFRLGRAYLAADRPEDASVALARAKEEDVAPLRALEPVVAAVTRVAEEEGVPVVPLRDDLEAESRRVHGHSALGDEYLLDHVHPDTPVHARLADALLDELADAGVVNPGAAWDDAARTALYERQMADFDAAYYGRRDLNLSKVLGWAGKLEEAEEPLRRAAEAIPEEPEVWLNLGVLYQRTGRFEASLEALTRAEALAPNWHLVHFNRGVTLGRLGRDAEGVEALRRALELEPDSAEAARNLATLLRRSGDDAGALEALERAEALAAEAGGEAGGLSAENLEYERALLARRQGRLAEAEAVFRRWVDERPDDAAARADLGITLARLGRLAEAAEHLERALAEAPDQSEAWYNLGVVRAAQARNGGASLGDAEEAYLRALALAPEHPEANNNLGIVLAARGDLASALDRFRTATEASPEWAEARFNLGVALDGSGRSGEAISEIRRAVELEPDNGRFRLALGSLLAAQGDAAEALEHLEAARQAGQPVPDEVLDRLRQ